MILTRFWLLLLALLAAVGVTTSWVATHIVAEERQQTMQDALRRDSLEMMMMLRQDARARLDAIGPIAANLDIRNGLRPRRNDAARTRVRTKLAELNAQLGELAGDIIFAIDRDGTIVGQAGGLAPPGANAGLGAFPAVRRALSGFLRDDVWLFNGDVYRIAARPVVESGDYVGAIVHAKKFDRVFAARLAERLLAGVAFFREQQLLAFAAPSSADLVPNESDVTQAITSLDVQVLASQEQGLALTIGSDGRGQFLLPPGAAQAAHFGIALTRRTPQSGPLAILENASAEDWNHISWPAIAGLFLFLIALGMLFVWLERDRPLKKLESALRKIVDRSENRLAPSSFGGPLRMIAASVNDALDSNVPPAQKVAPDLDALLGAKKPAEPSFYGFADASSPQQQAAQIANTPTPPPPAKEPAAPLFTRSQPPGAQSAGARASMQNIPQPPQRIPTPPRSPSGTLPLTPSPMAGNRPSTRPLPPKPPVPQAGSTNLGMPAIPQAFGDGPIQAGARRSDAHDSEEVETSIQGRFDASGEQHRAVFEQYVAAKRECGEPVDGLTFDKFLATVRKQEEQIAAEHGAARVLFSVYIKDGKAKLKASPQRV